MIIGYHRIVPTTEAECLDMLKSEMRAAISSCDQIAQTPVSGVHFDRMIKALQAIEMCARQMFTYRENHNWLNGIFHFAEIQTKAQQWLTPATVYSKKLFTILADNLRKLESLYCRLSVIRNGSARPVLPAIQAGPLRSGRPVQVLMPGATRPGSRLILPDGMRAHG